MNTIFVGFGTDATLFRVEMPEGATPQELIEKALYSAATAAVNPTIFQFLPNGAVELKMVFGNIADFVLRTETGAAVQRLDQSLYIVYHKSQVEEAMREEDAPETEVPQECRVQKRSRESAPPPVFNVVDRGYTLAHGELQPIWDNPEVAMEALRGVGVEDLGFSKKNKSSVSEISYWRAGEQVVVKCNDPLGDIWTERIISHMERHGDARIRSFVSQCFLFPRGMGFFFVLLADPTGELCDDMDTDCAAEWALGRLAEQRPELYGEEEKERKRPREASDPDETPVYPILLALPEREIDLELSALPLN